MFLALHPMESISLNSFVLLEHLAMLLNSTLAINCYLRSFYGDLVYTCTFKKLVGSNNFSAHFIKLFLSIRRLART